MWKLRSIVVFELYNTENNRDIRIFPTLRQFDTFWKSLTDFFLLTAMSIDAIIFAAKEIFLLPVGTNPNTANVLESNKWYKLIHRIHNTKRCRRNGPVLAIGRIVHEEMHVVVLEQYQFEK